MNISSTLADLTRSVSLCGEIPAYLAGMLRLEPITLAVVKEEPSKEPTLWLYSSSDGMLISEPASVPPNLLSIYRQTRPLTATEGPMLRSMFELDQDHSRMSAGGLVDYPRALVLAHSLDEQHRMLLVIHQRVQDAHPADGMIDILNLVSRQLARMLSCLIAEQTQPVVLGKPFEQLTDKQWSVLRGLDSDLSEKQLADLLKLSPHTLHSHIKSVYRRLGVQGRLSMLKQLESARRNWRLSQLNVQPAAKSMSAAYEPAAAAG
jgi:DNA-binding CsgD family transcriptional regulator